MAYTVAIYEINRAYGGPEEGGWWFDYGQPVGQLIPHRRRFKNRAQAANYAQRLTAKLDRSINQGCEPLSSVNCPGLLVAFVTSSAPRVFPAVRPSYC